MPVKICYSELEPHGSERNKKHAGQAPIRRHYQDRLAEKQGTLETAHRNLVHRTYQYKALSCFRVGVHYCGSGIGVQIHKRCSSDSLGYPLVFQNLIGRITVYGYYCVGYEARTRMPQKRLW